MQLFFVFVVTETGHIGRCTENSRCEESQSCRMSNFTVSIQAGSKRGKERNEQVINICGDTKGSLKIFPRFG